MNNYKYILKKILKNKPPLYQNKIITAEDK